MARFWELLRKIATQRRYQVSLGLCLGGLTMIVGSHLLEENRIGPHLMWTLLAEIGIACIIAAIAEFILLEHAGEVFLHEIQELKTLLEQASESLRQQARQDMKEARQDMKILSHCMEHQLIDVMPFTTREPEDLSAREFSSILEKARDEIRIIAFTLGDILHHSTFLETPLKNLLERDARVEVKLLLVDPTSDAAHIRVKAEEGPDITFEKSHLHHDLWKNFYAIKGMMSHAESKTRFKMQARFYNILPNFYMVSTPDEVFIEPYHLGGKTGDATNGGTVPLLRFRANSPMYKVANSHFSYIWDNVTNGAPPSNVPGDGGRPGNGYIRVRTMDEVNGEVNRRLGGPERRKKNVAVAVERRTSSDRRSIISDRRGMTATAAS